MRNYFRFIKIHSRAFGIALIFSIFVASLSFFIYISLEEWKNQVIQTNMVLSDVLTEQLLLSAAETAQNLDNQNLFEIQILDAEQSKLIDEQLKRLSDLLFSRTKGIEGGFFITQYNEFFGYAYPTSPPPKPVYGPPPRSYNIIKEQVMETINTDKSITRLHQFDPAIFPLSTRPLKIGNKAIGAVWARIHIERELPYLKLRQVINIGAIVALIGFLVAGLSSLVVRKKIQRLNADLEAIQDGKVNEVRSSSGNLEYIGRSINRMVSALNKEHKEREKLERELNQRARMAALGRLVAGVAHEVKTPLAIVKTRIQMWQRDLEKNTVKDLPDSLSNESMQMIVNETNRLNELVKRLLYFSRPVAPNLKPVSINDILKHTLLFLKTSIKQEKLQFDTEYDPSVPDLLGDPNALEQVFINLIMNALESGADEAPVAIKTRFSKEKQTVIIEISDQGNGIDEEHVQKIFDPFFTTKDKGFGLGLSISYEIITALKGNIRFESNQSQGTICIIEIPSEDKG